MIFRAVYIHRIHNGGRSRKDWCPNHQLEAGQYYSFSFAGFRLSKATPEFVVVFAILQLCLRTLMALESDLTSLALVFSRRPPLWTRSIIWCPYVYRERPLLYWIILFKSNSLRSSILYKRYCFSVVLTMKERLVRTNKNRFVVAKCNCEFIGRLSTNCQSLEKLW